MTLRVLICTPQAHVARAMALHLLRADVDVWTVSDGEQAQDRLSQVHPDILIADIDAADKSGWDAMTSIPPQGHVRLVALTEHSLDAVEKLSRERGLSVDETLALPFSPRQFRTRTNVWRQRREQLTGN